MPKGAGHAAVASVGRPCMLAAVLLLGVAPVRPMPPVRRARPRPPTPDGPPWKLIGPYGVREVIEDRGAVSIFCAAEGLDVFNIEHLLGIVPGNSMQPLHVKFYQPQHLMLFLRRHDSTELVPVLGGPGKGKKRAKLVWTISLHWWQVNDRICRLSHSTEINYSNSW